MEEFDEKITGSFELSFERSVIKVIDKLRINIIIESMDGRSIVIGMRPRETILELKKKIRDKIRFDEEEHCLDYRGTLLIGDRRRIHDCGITGGNIIKVVKVTKFDITVFAKISYEDIVELMVSNTDRIIDLKKKIHDKIGLSPDEQQLVYQGELLEDDKTVDHCKIADMGSIDVVLRFREEIRIFAKTMDGKTVAFEVTKYERIIDVKKKIHEKIGLYPDEQRLVYDGLILYDHETVDYYKITEKSVINVVARFIEEIRIFAKTMDGNKFVLCVINNDRIIDIKKKIEEKIGLSPDEQKLIFNGQPLYDDDKTVDHYNIVENSVINVVNKLSGGGGMKIFAKTMDGNIFVLYVMNDARIIDVKKKIHDKIGLSPDEQQLVYQGGILEDDKTVDHYNIVEKSVIDVIPRTICDLRIFVTTKNGGTIMLEVTNFDRIIDIKKKIEEKILVSPDEQLIKVNGHLVRDDNARLYNCDITNNCIIDVFRVLKINIKILTHNMETVQIQVLNNDRIIDVKMKIGDKIGLPSEYQRLEYLGESLDDDKLLCEYNINGNSDVTILKPIKQKTRGICFVISNEHFTNNLDPRTGTKLDEERIRSIFETMGYKVKIHPNVRNSDMDSVIKDTKKLVKSSHKILIVFILSHGEENGVYTSDGAIIPLKNICTPFTNTKFPLFVGKPKIFFFVCCQGSNENPGVNVACGSTTVYDSPTPVTRVPAMADLFLGYATCPSYVSCRTATEGTFYVSTLCDVIKEHPRWSVVDIHQEVQSIISRIFINDGRYFQMPYCENILREHAYFVDQ